MGRHAGTDRNGFPCCWSYSLSLHQELAAATTLLTLTHGRPFGGGLPDEALFASPG